MCVRNALFIFLLVVCFDKALGSYRLVGASYVEPDTVMFHASLQNLSGYHVCGGGVVSSRHIITAAHCVLGARPEYVNIVVGTTNLDKGGLQYEVQDIELYSDYNPKTRANDIAIITSKESFDTDLVDVIDLYNKDLVQDDSVLVTGFGAIEPNGNSLRQMLYLNLTVMNQDICKYAMRNNQDVLDSMFCTFTRIGEGTCHGDSGGPIVKDNKLVGLISWGIPCAVGFPDVHTRVKSFKSWIDSRIRQ